MSATQPGITIFAIPKPFDGHTGLIQRNAIESWSRLEGVHVLLIGDDDGVAEAARAVGARHLPRVEKSTEGTPLVSAAFRLAQGAACTSILTYANADIIFLPDFVDSVGRIRFQDFLAVGQRWNVGIRLPIDFGNSEWESKLRGRVAEQPDLSDHLWIDYFVLPRESRLIGDMPPFVVGRPRWDNWLIERARACRIPVIDATRAITAVHQRHDYSHVPSGTGDRWAGPEADANIDLYGHSGAQALGIWHSTHVLGRRWLAPALDRRHVRIRWQSRQHVDGRLERLTRRIDPALAPLRWLYRLRRARRGAG